MARQDKVAKRGIVEAQETVQSRMVGWQIKVKSGLARRHSKMQSRLAAWHSSLL